MRFVLNILTAVVFFFFLSFVFIFQLLSRHVCVLNQQKKIHICLMLVYTNERLSFRTRGFECQFEIEFKQLFQWNSNAYVRHVNCQFSLIVIFNLTGCCFQSIVPFQNDFIEIWMVFQSLRSLFIFMAIN